jgi:hypothetical protein
MIRYRAEVKEKKKKQKLQELREKGLISPSSDWTLDWCFVFILSDYYFIRLIKNPSFRKIFKRHLTRQQCHKRCQSKPYIMYSWTDQISIMFREKLVIAYETYHFLLYLWETFYALKRDGIRWCPGLVDLKKKTYSWYNIPIDHKYYIQPVIYR